MALLDAGPDFSPLRMQQILQILQSLSAPEQSVGAAPVPTTQATTAMPAQAPTQAPVNTQAASVAPDNSSALSSAILTQLLSYSPETAASQALMAHIMGMPQRENYQPSGLRQVGAALAGLGAKDPMEALNVQQAYRDVPYTRALAPWQEKLKPLEIAAANERAGNLNMRGLLLGETARLGQMQHYEDQARRYEAQSANEKEKIRLQEWALKHPNWTFEYDDKGNVFARNPKDPTAPLEYYYDEEGNNVKSGKFAAVGIRAEASKENARTAANARIEAARIAAGRTDNAGWSYFLVNDELWRANARLNRMEPAPGGVLPPELQTPPITPETAPGIPQTRPGQAMPTPGLPARTTAPVSSPAGPTVVPVAPQGATPGTPPTITRIGGPKRQPDITSSTRTMMEGAAMLLPHVKDLKEQAQYLQQHNLFGPIMGRIRDFAAQIGTTGDADDVAASMNKFADNISSDQKLNETGDYMVGRFLLNLGLMASGAGRVHGQARGGGSIQMIQYMKALLSANTSLTMFMGRADELDNYLRGYAAGPRAQEKSKSELDKIIDEALKRKK